MLISCPECHKQVSDQASNCPGCGCVGQAESGLVSGEDMRQAGMGSTDDAQQRPHGNTVMRILTWGNRLPFVYRTLFFMGIAAVGCFVTSLTVTCILNILR